MANSPLQDPNERKKDDLTFRLRLWMTGWVGLMGFRPPPEPEQIAVAVPGPELTGAAPNHPVDPADGATPLSVLRASRRPGAVINGVEFEVELPDRPLPRRQTKPPEL